MTISADLNTIVPSNSPFEGAAMEYVKHGIKVFPVHEMIRRPDGSLECSCQSWKRKQAREMYGKEAAPCEQPGKHPRVKWKTDATTDPAQIGRWAKKWPRANIGLVTGNGLMVLDIDGEAGATALTALEKQHAPLQQTVTVRTGSGGAHYYLALPPGHPMPNSASKVADKIDVRGDGGYVVAPPSNHRSGGAYSFLSGRGLHQIDIGPAPEWLIALAAPSKEKSRVNRDRKAKKRSDSATKKSPSQRQGFEDALASIGDGEGQGGFDTPINQAACSYFATHGVDAGTEPLKQKLREVIDAAIEDPTKPRKDRYSSDAYLDERIEKARAFIESQATTGKDDPYIFFEDDKLVEAINQNFALVTIGGSARYIRERGDEIDILNKQACQDVLAPFTLFIKKDDKEVMRIDGFKAWMKSGNRRVYEGMVFEPCRETGNKYNLWQGFAAVSKNGDWSKMKKHLLEVVCKGDQSHYEYLLSLLAQSVQDPCNRPGVAIVLRGLKGTGKSMVAEWVSDMFGVHATTIDKAKLLTGQFNAHLEKCVWLVTEEGFWAGDKDAEGVLKNLITGSKIMLERKGVDAVPISNHVHLLIATNAEWAVPATYDERRFFVLDVSDVRKGDREYFSALHAERVSGGVEAMLHDLLEWDYSSVDLRNPPRTDGLKQQILTGLPMKVKWWHSVLHDGDFISKDGEDAGSDVNAWLAGSAEVRKSVVHASYNTFVPGVKGKPWPASTVSMFLKEMAPDLESTRRTNLSERERCYLFPPLSILRARFTEKYGLEFMPDKDDQDSFEPAKRSRSAHGAATSKRTI